MKKTNLVTFELSETARPVLQALSLGQGQSDLNKAAKFIIEDSCTRMKSHLQMMVYPDMIHAVVELNWVEVRAVRWFQHKFWPEHENVALGDIIRVIIQRALAHPKDLARMEVAFRSYRESEGYNGTGMGNKLALTRIEQQPEYQQ